jgi:chromosome segregation ATPase
LRISNKSEAKEEVAATQREVDESEGKVKDLHDKLVRMRAQMRALKSKAHPISVKLEKTKQDVEDLREALALEQPDSGKVKGYNDAIEDAKEERKTLLAQVLALHERQGEALEEYKQLDNVKKQKASALKTLEKDIELTAVQPSPSRLIQDELKKATLDRVSVSTKLTWWTKKIPELEKALTETEAQRDTEVAALEVVD